MRGELVFTDTPLADALPRLSRCCNDRDVRHLERDTQSWRTSPHRALSRRPTCRCRLRWRRARVGRTRLASGPRRRLVGGKVTTVARRVVVAVSLLAAPQVVGGQNSAPAPAFVQLDHARPLPPAHETRVSLTLERIALRDAVDSVARRAGISFVADSALTGPRSAPVSCSRVRDV